MSDAVTHPSHYTRRFGIECIELTRHLSFCAGNAVKYIWRHLDKGQPLEDLRKAEQYLLWVIEHQEPAPPKDAARIADKHLLLCPPPFSAMRCLAHGWFGWALDQVRAQITLLEEAA